MKDWSAFLSSLIEKFDFKKLIVCAFTVLALMLVPGINFLNFLMPLDNAEKWIIFIFSLISVYIVLSILVFLRQQIKHYFKCKPKKLLRLMEKYGQYINIFYSDEINEYSSNSVNLDRYDISQDVILKLSENNIIECAGYLCSEYRLTKKARKKLTRIKKMVMFIDGKIINRNKQEAGKK